MVAGVMAIFVVIMSEMTVALSIMMMERQLAPGSEKSGAAAAAAPRLFARLISRQDRRKLRAFTQSKRAHQQTRNNS